MAFKVGDIVKLKSGGPRMTVVDATPETIYVAWFPGTQSESRADFPAEALEIVDAKDMGISFA
jgi:uncharacterized protein YodC (DUF2158 family)